MENFGDLARDRLDLNGEQIVIDEAIPIKESCFRAVYVGSQKVSMSRAIQLVCDNGNIYIAYRDYGLDKIVHLGKMACQTARTSSTTASSRFMTALSANR